MNNLCTLNNLSPGQCATVDSLDCRGSMRRRLLDIGFVRSTRVECVGQSPHGDPKAYLVRGAVMAVRSEDGRHIFVRPQ